MIFGKLCGITLQGKVAAEEYNSALSGYSFIFMIMVVTISSGVLLVLGYILLGGIGNACALHRRFIERIYKNRKLC